MRIIKATKYSMEGFGAALVNESAFRTEVAMVVVLAPTIGAMNIEMSYKVMVWMSMGVILVTELLNSAVEAVVDMTAQGYHPLAKRAKDMGSAAVFVSLMIFALALGVALWDWTSKT